MDRLKGETTQGLPPGSSGTLPASSAWAPNVVRGLEAALYLDELAPTRWYGASTRVEQMGGDASNPCLYGMVPPLPGDGMAHARAHAIHERAAEGGASSRVTGMTAAWDMHHPGADSAGALDDHAPSCATRNRPSDS